MVRQEEFHKYVIAIPAPLTTEPLSLLWLDFEGMSGQRCQQFQVQLLVFLV